MLIWNALKVMPLPMPAPSSLPFTDKKEIIMKKITTLLVPLLLICFCVFAQEVVVWENEGKVAVTTPTEEFTAQEIQAKDIPEGVTSYIVDDSTLPDNQWRDAWVLNNGVVTIDEAKKASVILSRFNPELAIGREAQVFSALDMVRFAPIGYNINELIRFKNFWGGVTEGNVPYVGLKQFCQAAIASGTGMFTQNDYDRLNGILKEQGIDLDAQ
jgi:hypothetical protein